MPVLAEILLVAVLALAVMRLAREPWRGRLLNVLKAFVTVEAFRLLLWHPVTQEDGTQVVAWKLILQELQGIDAATFWTFVLCATVIKFGGILSSMYRWLLLLRGQGIDLPFRHIFGTFLIGRFIGTFLPSTAGLDGYKLYDAARFSGRTVEVTATTALEKVLGVSGIFLSFLVALPFGIRIFGDQAGLVAAVTVPVSLALIGALLTVLWYPALVEWALRVLPIPGKARLHGLVMRLSHAAAAYRDKKALVLAALGLSFLVHFTTAAMYYFTALAIGATGAEFWPIAFGSSIQILATVLSPFTIAGAGIREAAQFVLLGHMIGPAKAIVSAALGFWAAEALTLAGGVFWWIRPSDYRPAWCRVDGVQVDYDAAASAALEITDAQDRAAIAREDVPSMGGRIVQGAGLGLGTGLLSGLVIGAAEAAVLALGGLGGDTQVLWFGPLAYAVVLAGLGMAGGGALGLLPLTRQELRGWVPTLGSVALLVPLGLFIALFRVRRDLFLEQAVPLPWLLGIVGAGAAVALMLLLAGRRLFTSRAGGLLRPLPATAVTALVVAAGGIAAWALAPAATPTPAPAPVPAALADRPNVLFIMVDTLRGDHVPCDDTAPVATPAICSLTDGHGTRFFGFAHASWTKPSTATMLSGLLPSSHGATTKAASIGPDVEMLAEAMKEHGYSTGGIVSNINLAPSFGFAQGFDEYHYLAPDYLAGASESSSKLILYQIVRKLWFRVQPGFRVGDYYQNAETVNARAFDWLERHADSRFFMFLHYMDPHDPYFRHPYDGHAIARVTNDHPDPALAPEMRELYAGEIAYLDAHLARLFDRLRALDLWEDTLIVLTSDHGEEFDDHGGFWHGLTLYDEQVHVPLLVKWPAGRVQGAPAVEPDLARQIDLPPTILALAGARTPAAMKGVDLVARMEDAIPADDPRHTLLAENDLEGNVLQALRTMDWKLISANAGNPRGLPEEALYHVAVDPGERTNLEAEHPERVIAMKRETTSLVELAKSEAVEGGGDARLSESQREALRALGYME